MVGNGGLDKVWPLINSKINVWTHWNKKLIYFNSSMRAHDFNCVVVVYKGKGVIADMDIGLIAKLSLSFNFILTELIFNFVFPPPTQKSSAG